MAQALGHQQKAKQKPMKWATACERPHAIQGLSPALAGLDFKSAL